MMYKTKDTLFFNEDDINKLAAKHKQLEDIRNEKKKKILDSDEYIKWLEKFTINGGFKDTDGLYNLDNLSEYDKNNVKDIGIMFEVIESYADNNYISINPLSFGGCYYIKYNNVGYEIACLTGQGTVFLCDRVPINGFFIDYADIMNGKRKDDAYRIDNELDRLSIYLSTISNYIPVNVIRNVVNETLDNVSLNKKMSLSKNK